MPRRIPIAFVLAALLAAALLVAPLEEGSERPTGANSVDAGAETSRPTATTDASSRPDAAAPGRQGAGAATARGASGCTVEQLEAALYGGQSPAEVMRRRGEEIYPILAAADDAELLIASIMLGDFAAPADRIASIDRALALAPKHPLVLWRAFSACAGTDSGSFCSDPRRRANTDAVLGHNGAYWSMVAGDLEQRGDVDDALAAMIRAGSAPEFDYYFADHVVLLERALAVSSDLPYRARISEALVILAMQEPHWFPVQLCTQRSAGDDNWLSACGGFADRLAGDGRTIMEGRMGLELKERLSSAATGETPSATLTLDEDSLSDDLRRLFELDPASMELMAQWMLADDNFAASYVDELLANGEASALLRSTGEAVRRQAEGGQDPCRFAGLPPP